MKPCEGKREIDNSFMRDICIVRGWTKQPVKKDINTAIKKNLRVTITEKYFFSVQVFQNGKGSMMNKF